MRSPRISVSPSPYDDEIDKPAYFARSWRVSDWIDRQELERIFVEGDGAFVTYRCMAKGGKSFRNTEFFTFEGNRIKRIDVYFGATYQNGAFVNNKKIETGVPACRLRCISTRWHPTATRR